MFYTFPHIEHIDQVLPAIEGSTEFIVAERGAYKIINYLVALPNTFPEIKSPNDEEDNHAAIRRECRGIIFCNETGKILRRPFEKFFNINEKSETQIDCLDFTQEHKVYTKLDGSMISPFEVGYGSGIIRFGTKMGYGTDVANNAEDFIKENTKYMEFAKWCITNRLTPIFEYTAPNNRIVISYEKSQLTLLAVRHMITGQYMDID